MATKKNYLKLTQSLSKPTKHQALQPSTQTKGYGITLILDRKGNFRKRSKVTSASSVNVASPLLASDITDNEVRNNIRLPGDMKSYLKN